MSVEGLPKNVSRPLPTSSQKAGADDGLTSGSVNEVAYAIAESGGTQCGFCTPGFTMTLYEAQQRHLLEKACVSKCGDHSKSCEKDPKHCDHEILTDIEDLYSGHICRCTGYRGLRLAAKRVLLPENEEVKKELIEVPSYVVDVEQKNYSHKTLAREPQRGVGQLEGRQPSEETGGSRTIFTETCHKVADNGSDVQVVRCSNSTPVHF